MSWLKVSDAFAMHPLLLQVLEFPEADDRILNEFAGFITRCGTSAAAYETDYIITKGMVQTLAGSFARNEVLCDLALNIGVFTAMKDPKGRIVYKLIEEEDLVHMIEKAERLWRNRRKQDNRNPKLTVPVRKRDGDECRWCGQIVNWNNDRKSGRAGTYDHLNPGQGSATPEEMVVCCKTCNSSRQDDAPSWDRTLRPAPETPYYSKATVTFLAKYNVNVTPSDSLPIEVAGAEPTISLTPVEPATAVETTQVEPTTVEPETPAPAAQAPRATTPHQAQAPEAETYEIDRDNLEQSIADAPDWVQAEWHKTESGRTRQISTVTNLDLSGRDGTGRRNANHKRTQETSETGTTAPKPRKRRRRRRRRKAVKPETNQGTSSRKESTDA